MKIGLDSHGKGENEVRGDEAKSWNVSLHFTVTWKIRPAYHVLMRSMLTHSFNEGENIINLAR